MELEQERMQSERFQSEIMEIQREFEREIREKERQHKNKEKVKNIVNIKELINSFLRMEIGKVPTKTSVLESFVPERDRP